MSAEEPLEVSSGEQGSQKRKRNGSTQQGTPAKSVRPISPHEFWDLYTSLPGQNHLSNSTLESYQSAWGQFSEWLLTEVGQYLSALPRNFPAQYAQWVNNADHIEKKPLSLRTHLDRIEGITRTAHVHGYIQCSPEPELWDEIKPKITSKGVEIRDDPLDPARIPEITEWLESEHQYSRDHVLWILLTRYGLRSSAIRAIDLGHLHLSAGSVDDCQDEEKFQEHVLLQDRPGLGDNGDGLPLKNTREHLADRSIPLAKEDAITLGTYVRNGSKTGAKSSRKVFDRNDKFGQTGLLTTQTSPRISHSTIQNRCHWLTCPTTVGTQCDCRGCSEYRTQHGKDPAPHEIQQVCDVSRSPHQVRHGAITRLLNSYDAATVAQVVGTSMKTIRHVYDRASQYQRMKRLSKSFP